MRKYIFGQTDLEGDIISIERIIENRISSKVPPSIRDVSCSTSYDYSTQFHSLVIKGYTVLESTENREYEIKCFALEEKVADEVTTNEEIIDTLKILIEEFIRAFKEAIEDRNIAPIEMIDRVESTVGSLKENHGLKIKWMDDEDIL